MGEWKRRLGGWMDDVAMELKNEKEGKLNSKQTLNIGALYLFTPASIH